jgi:hypothetical protein
MVNVFSGSSTGQYSRRCGEFPPYHPGLTAASVRVPCASFLGHRGGGFATIVGALDVARFIVPFRLLFKSLVFSVSVLTTGTHKQINAIQMMSEIIVPLLLGPIGRR